MAEDLKLTKARSNSFGLYVRAKREAAGLSLARAAQRIGCTKAHLWDLEQERSRNPGVQLLAGMSLTFGVPVADLAVMAAQPFLRSALSQEGK
jgi:transcriptional regulator with XRE-family HTH domain